MDTDAPTHELPAPVFAAELDDIQQRRASAGLEPVPVCDNQRPHAELGLVGLALSGGGIRSATFGLGVVQVLAAAGLLRRVDYLSTVSGGGFTGSLLSSVLNRPHAAHGEFPLAKRVGAAENAALRHLRDHSNYLSSGSLLESLRLPMVILRGLILSVLLVAPLVMLAVFMTEVVYESGLWPSYDGLTRGSSPVLFALTIVAFVVSVCLALPIKRTLGRRLTWKLRNRGELLLAVSLTVILGALLSEVVCGLTSRAIETTASGAGVVATALALLGYDGQISHIALVGGLIGVPAVLALIWRLLKRPMVELLIYASGLLGPGLVFGLYLGLCVLQINSPFVHADLDDTLEQLADATHSGALDQATLDDDVARAHQHLLDALALKQLAIELEPHQRLRVMRASSTGSCAPDRPHEWLILGPELSGDSSRLATALGDCVPVTPAARERSFATELAVLLGLADRLDDDTCSWPALTPEGQFPLTDDLLENCPASFRVTPTQLWLTPLHGDIDAPLEIRGGQLELWGEAPGTALVSDRMFLGVALAMLIYIGFFYDINATSLHSFYRDRLSRLYLIGLRDDGEVEHNDGLRLSQLNHEGSVAPYHLLNVALNLSGSQTDQRGRHAGFFVLSKRYCGGPATGYAPTTALERLDPHLDLGTAMAISGAAASPNMGSMTSGPLVFIMTLLNLRMNYWLINPRHARGSGRWRRFRAGPSYLIAEAFGNSTADRPLVNVSDGGHLENLGVYELLRRRCKLIIVVDGEHDPGLSCASLLTALRYANIDLGIEVDVEAMQLARLRPDADGFSSVQWADAPIHYSETEVGHLVYIKSSATQALSPQLLHYRTQHPQFPHESTADQFFDEQQFECYRALGETVAERLLAAPPAELLAVMPHSGA